MANFPIPIDETISGIDALRTATKNKFGLFPYSADNPKTAGWRMSQPAAVEINVEPKFTLSNEDPVFTMGSCFARNVEDSLIRMGVPIVLADFDFPEKYFAPEYNAFKNGMMDSPLRGLAIRSVLNKYTPYSMLNEFERILRPENFKDPFKGLIEFDKDRWYDPHTKNLRLMPLEESLVARDFVEGATARVFDAKAVFLTLGFTETWFDSDTGLALNMSPFPPLIKKNPDRFRFYNAAHRDVLSSLENIFNLISEYVRSDMKFIVTVSPVPLGRTFTDMDVISANTYSKSTLRSAVGEFCANHDNVDYFPSYEMIMSTNPNIAWMEDRVHPLREMVDVVIGQFTKHYYGSSEPVTRQKPQQSLSSR